MKNDLPIYSEEASMGNKGRRIVEGIVHDQLGWLFREVQKDDLGIDAFLESLDEKNRSSGRLLALQIKCGHSYLKERDGDGFVYRFDNKHANYWLGFSLPVIVVLVNPDTSECYWAAVNPGTVQSTGNGWKVSVPLSHPLNGESKLPLSWLVDGMQPVDVLPLAIYRWLSEKFRGIQIAQSLEMPRDLWGFDLLADLDGDLVLITHIYHAAGPFTVADVDLVLEALAITVKGAGWDSSGIVPKVFLCFVAESVERFEVVPSVAARVANHPQFQLFRLQCSFDHGVDLSELDDQDCPISLY